MWIWLTISPKAGIIGHSMRLRSVLSLVLLAALCAPLPALHLHLAHDADHASLLHAHFGAHTRASVPVSSLAEPNSDATYVDTVACVPSSLNVPVHLIAVRADSTGSTVDASVTFGGWGQPEGSVHDPPVSTPGLRAPPTLLD